ncbi:nucleotidyltransferase family protein [Bacillus sp. B15-48]|uniref:NTP transferase domain-containing protein n=1 Tax=Bacillus sp. B15-48 TaxID=1548601 RepID=UPI00193F34C3|nr:NTP transferase domain-containing protein [Bacillus sp. B15-48]
MLKVILKKNVNDSFGAVILAAGMSKRMGEPKLLLPIKNKPMFLYSVHTATSAELSPIIVVTGPKHDKMSLLVDRSDITILENTEYEQGMGTSLRKGMEQMAKKNVDAAFVMLADQPFVPSKLLSHMIHLYHQHRPNGYLIIQPQYKTGYGHPVLFDKSLFEQFAHLKGDVGGKYLLEKYTNEVIRFSVANPSWNFDVDDIEDYKQAKKIMDNHR